MKKLVLAAVLFAGTSSAAFADDGCVTILWWTFCLPPPPVHHNPVTVPEIDPASALAGLALMAGGLAVLRGRRTKA